MKAKLFTLLTILLLTSCQPKKEEKYFIVEGFNTLILPYPSSENLKDEYIGDIDGIPVHLEKENHQLKVVIPNLENGRYKLSFELDEINLEIKHSEIDNPSLFLDGLRRKYESDLDRLETLPATENEINDIEAIKTLYRIVTYQFELLPPETQNSILTYISKSASSITFSENESATKNLSLASECVPDNEYQIVHCEAERLSEEIRDLLAKIQGTKNFAQLSLDLINDISTAFLAGSILSNPGASIIMVPTLKSLKDIAKSANEKFTGLDDASKAGIIGTLMISAIWAPTSQILKKDLITFINKNQIYDLNFRTQNSKFVFYSGDTSKIKLKLRPIQISDRSNFPNFMSWYTLLQIKVPDYHIPDFGAVKIFV